MPRASDQLKDLKRRAEKALQLGDGLDFLLEEIPFRIIRRTLLGKDINNTPLKPLSKQYVSFRKLNPSILSKDAKPSKSNLTLTGEMLSSIAGVRNGTVFTFTFTNAEADKKAEFVRKGGRKFFGLSVLDTKALTQKVSKILRDNLRELFKG